MSGSAYSASSAQDDVRVDGVISRLEDPAIYKPGGYHPIAIGDELHNGRYRIIHRLGHGAFSTVWLALDQRYEKTIIADANAPCSRYVAVKISTARSQNDEVAILRQLQGRPQSQFPNWESWLFSFSLFGGNTERDKCRSVVAVLDEFETHGPNGSHRCLVTELLGPSVDDIKSCPAIEGWHLLPLPIARRAAVQCAEAVASLHSHGIVHGDLHTGNIMFALTVDIHAWSVEEVYAALGGEPVKVPFHKALWSMCGLMPPTDLDSPHQPQYLVCPPSVSRLWALCSSSTPNIRLIDFTESFRAPFAPERQRLPGTPRMFAAPELLLELPSEVTMAIDVWALGCTIYEIFGSDGPFVPIGTLARYLADIVVLLGGEKNVPERFRKAFCESGAQSAAKISRLRQTWDYRIAWMRGDPEEGDLPLGKEDEAVIRKLIAAALVIEPADRASAAAILAMLQQQGWETGKTE